MYGAATVWQSEHIDIITIPSGVSHILHSQSQIVWLFILQLWYENTVQSQEEHNNEYIM